MSRLLHTKTSTLHDGASFYVEQNDNCKTLGGRIFFTFTPYDLKNSSENVKPKMKKNCPADLQKFLKTKKNAFLDLGCRVQLIDH